jgi:4-amino-4-deoxy-L-arabinose transferase-like glycosyltransferase
MKTFEKHPWRKLMTCADALVRLAIEDKSRLIVSIIAGEASAFSLLHHIWNLWGLSWDRQVLSLLLLGPAFALLISIALKPIWDDCQAIEVRRWLEFGLPAGVIAAVLTWQLFSVPEVGHELTIDPQADSRVGEVRIREIRGAYGNTIPHAQFSSLDSWSLRDGLLIAATPAAEPIHYSFRGPIGEVIRISFVTSPQSGVVSVILDGQRLELDLRGAEGNETRARLLTQYRWGALNFLIVPLIVLVDMLAALFLLGILWAAHEIGMHRSPTGSVRDGATPVSHRAGIVFVCSAGLLMHTVNFLAVPLRVTKDGPSYLEGAVRWAQFHDLDGASTYRGPGTMFLFAPAISLFGRNPWGVKLGLHALALACVPLAYWIGWQLQRKHCVAIAAGLATVLAPDLYAYSNYVMSEVPDLFALLAFCAALLSALRTLSMRWMVLSLLAGSMAVLVRPDNFMALSIGAAFLGLAVWQIGRRGSDSDATAAVRSVRVRSLLLAVLAAALPLIAWSVHNARLHGFFGLSDYGGEVLYDGWVYYGERSGIWILDHDSKAVERIDEVFPITDHRGSDAPTGWTVWSALVENGYGSTDAFSLLGQAARDSIRRDLSKTSRLLVVKLQQAPRPQSTTPASFLSSDTEGLHAELTARYFDAEAGLVPSLARLQDCANDSVYIAYRYVYTFWLIIGMPMLWLAFYRRPSLVWMPAVVITLNALMLPIIVGMASWRYLIPGTALLTPIALATLDTLGNYVQEYSTRAGAISQAMAPNRCDG